MRTGWYNYIGPKSCKTTRNGSLMVKVVLSTKLLSIRRHKNKSIFYSTIRNLFFIAISPVDTTISWRPVRCGHKTTKRCSSHFLLGVMLCYALLLDSLVMLGIVSPQCRFLKMMLYENCVKLWRSYCVVSA